MRRKLLFTSVFVLSIAFSACSRIATPAQVVPNSKQEAASEKLVEAKPTTLPATPEPVNKPDPLLPADPQEISFKASDGQELMGYYYPSASDKPGPLVVLMHWVVGDMSDWYEIAPWLQNRGLINPFKSPSKFGWLNPTWFPTISPDQSFGVFIFTFRDCAPFPVGCKGFDKAGWILDAQAAMEKAAELEGVDATRIAAIGSSIGADAVVDACAWVNAQQPGACRGALSLSPCNCLKNSYYENVKKLGELPEPPAVWCFADEKEIFQCQLAGKIGNPSFKISEFPGGGHGNSLLNQNVEPSAMQGILDFLSTALK